jgi:hypothetical protein
VKNTKSNNNHPNPNQLEPDPVIIDIRLSSGIGTDLFLEKSKNFEFIPTLIADIAIILQMEPAR